MEDFTKIKLINSLIDAVTHFYDLKQKGDVDTKHLKGFCEGMSYVLVEMKLIEKDEAKRILQGLGKKIDDKEIKKRMEQNDLDIPTIFRKKELTPDSSLI